jgi:hypothetical protein
MRIAVDIVHMALAHIEPGTEIVQVTRRFQLMCEGIRLPEKQGRHHNDLLKRMLGTRCSKTVLYKRQVVLLLDDRGRLLLPTFKNSNGEQQAS